MYTEGDEVTIQTGEYEGCTGTLMTDMGDGDWLVYIPAKGSPLINERDFA